MDKNELIIQDFKNAFGEVGLFLVTNGFNDEFEVLLGYYKKYQERKWQINDLK